MKAIAILLGLASLQESSQAVQLNDLKANDEALIKLWDELDTKEEAPAEAPPAPPKVAKAETTPEDEDAKRNSEAIAKIRASGDDSSKIFDSLHDHWSARDAMLQK